MKFLSGFESTQIHGSGKDVLELTNHTKYYREDLTLVKSCDLGLMRYSAPWHKIERAENKYDWTWMDATMNCLQELNVQPILDPLHHTSFPEWLKGGFANERFVDSYVKFVDALAERYGWARHYTIINEPFVTAFFCGHEGIWYPYLRGAKNFVPILLNVGRAISRASQILINKIPDVQLIHVDAAEQHRAVDEQSTLKAEFNNELRFLVQDLILGKITAAHPLYDYLRRNGATEKQLAWFVENPARIDVIGLDYYAHCELEWSAQGRVYPNENPVGFADLAMDYVERFNLPVMLSETNIRGFVSDRISWLKFMVEQSEQLQAKLDARQVPWLGFCWYPFIDSTDWNSLVKQANGNVDPQGIFCLDCERENRHSSELSDIFAALARGEIASADVPAYRFQSPLDETLKGFAPLMRHWDWREPQIDLNAVRYNDLKA